MVLTLLVLAPLFSDLPKPVLAAIIIDAVVFGMMDVPEMRRLWRVKRFDFWIAVLAIVGVLSAGVLAGVVIGIVLSVGWLVYVSSLSGHDRARPGAGHDGVPAAAGLPRRRDVPGAARRAFRRRVDVRDRRRVRRGDPAALPVVGTSRSPASSSTSPA